MKYYLFSSLLLLGICSCEPKSEYAQKEIIGSLYEDQGMTTYEGNLYSDSTFHIPSSGLINYSAGKFKVSGDTIHFISKQGTKILLGSYLFDTTKSQIFPLNPENTEGVYLYWLKKKQ